MEKKTKNAPVRSNKKLFIIIGVVLVVLVALGIAGKIIQKKIAQGMVGGFLSTLSGGKVKVGDKNVTFKNDQGEFSFEEGGKLPDGYPSDLPIYPGAKLTSSWSTTGDNSKGMSLIWGTNDSISQVADYYKKALEANGWKITASFSQQETSTYSFEKGTINGFVGIGKGDKENTNISVTIGFK